METPKESPQSPLLLDLGEVRFARLPTRRLVPVEKTCSAGLAQLVSLQRPI
jgi:hypothetical protein